MKLNAKLSKVELECLKGRIFQTGLCLRWHDIKRGKYTKTTRQKDMKSESYKTKEVKESHYS